MRRWRALRRYTQTKLHLAHLFNDSTCMHPVVSIRCTPTSSVLLPTTKMSLNLVAGEMHVLDAITDHSVRSSICYMSRFWWLYLHRITATVFRLQMYEQWRRTCQLWWCCLMPLFEPWRSASDEFTMACNWAASNKNRFGQNYVGTVNESRRSCKT